MSLGVTGDTLAIWTTALDTLTTAYRETVFTEGPATRAAMSSEAIIGIVSLGVTVIAGIVTYSLNARAQRKIDNREIYQRLEMASIDLFRFEADHLELMRPLWEEGAQFPAQDTAEWWATIDYVCQFLNLFEMASRFRRDHVMPHSAFASWVIWFHNLCEAPGFRTFWPEVKLDYMPELQKIMDRGVALLDEEPDADVRKKAFFDFVGNEVKCDIIRKWLDPVTPPASAPGISPSKANTGDPGTTIPSLIDWISNPDEAGDLAQFFAANVRADTAYISHGEVQDGRAVDFETWSPDLERVLAEEIRALIQRGSSLNDGSGVLVARSDNRIVGVALLEVAENAHGSYGLLHDLVVSRETRGRGVGTALVTRIENEWTKRGLKRALLESGLRNARAHAFFERHGYRVSSQTMTKEWKGGM